MFSLAQKICVVTGAGKGLGREIALTYARQGARVVGAARSAGDLASLKDEIEAMGGACAVMVCDVTDKEQVDALATLAVETFGSIDVWFNNAGGFVDGGLCDWIDITPEALDGMLKLNIASYVYGTQAAAAAMRASGKGGAILMMSSLDAFNPAPGGEGCYGACKIALNHMTETLAAELGQYGIRVNAIAPGIIETSLTAGALATPDMVADRSRFYPLGRVGQPSDVAAAAVYFASDEAAYTSGAVMLVAGGAVFNSDPFRYMMKVAEAKAAAR